MYIDKKPSAIRNIKASVSKAEIALLSILGCINIAIASVLCGLFDISPIIAAFCASGVYLLEIVLLGLKKKTEIADEATVTVHNFLDESGSSVFKNTTSPAIVYNRYGKILWYNDALSSALGKLDNRIGCEVDDIIGDKLLNDSELNKITIGERTYSAEGFTLSEKGDGLFLSLLSDVSDLSLLEKKYWDERVAVAYIAIDNVEDVL